MLLVRMFQNVDKVYHTTVLDDAPRAKLSSV